MPHFKVDRAFFKANFPSGQLHGKTLAKPDRAAGFDAIFDVWDETETLDFAEWLAYALATAWHETGTTMQPVREGFAKTDADAFAAVTAYCKRQGISNYAARHSNGNSYYGRGYVQLTHAINYQNMGHVLGVGSAYYDKPDLVMDAETAGRILLKGMMQGLFRPAKGKLSDYFSHSAMKWVEARDLINGDKAKKPDWAGGKTIGTLIGDYGKAFNGALRFLP